MLRKEIGLRVKNIRLNMNMTKQKMADLLGISGQYLGMIERGEGTLSVDKLKILCDMTGLSADYILFGRDFNSTLNLSNCRTMFWGRPSVCPCSILMKK